MKKRIILAVAMIAVLVCVLAVSISAAEPAYNDGEWIYAADGTTKLAIRDTDGNPLIWYMNGDQLKWVRADQTDETQNVYVKYTISSGGSGFDSNKYAPQKTLKDIDIYDNGTQIECAGINSALVLFNMERIDTDAINGWLWGSKHGCCQKLRGIVFPNTLKAIGTEGFTNHKVVQMWNLENTQLVYVSTSNSAPFSAATLTQEATNGVFKCPPTMQEPLAVQGSQIRVYIMNPESTFNTCQKWYQFLRSCKNLEKVFVSSHYAIGFGEEAFRDTPNKYITFITGTEEDATNMRDNTQDYCNGGFKASKIISYEAYLADQSTYDNATNQAYIVYGYNYCDAFYDGEHNDVGNDCVIECERCDDYDGQMKDEPKHNYTNVIEYANYLANGVKTQTCQNEGCAHNITPNEVAVNAIIKEFKGISTKENGDGLTFGYIIDYDALDEYMEISGNNVELGFVVAVKAFLGENQPLKENGEKAGDKVIKVEIYNSSASDEQIRYTGADFKLTGNWSKTVDLDGDGTEETDIKDVVFYMAGYIMDGNELSYINSDASSKEAGTAYYNQYN